MGRLIDVSELHNTVMLNKGEWGIFATPIDRLVESLVMQVSTVEAIPKADYENRLKADLVAMLTEIQLEIEEVARCPYTECIGGDCPFQDCMIHKGRVVSLIQSKINSLKEA